MPGKDLQIAILSGIPLRVAPWEGSRTSFHKNPVVCHGPDGVLRGVFPVRVEKFQRLRNAFLVPSGITIKGIVPGDDQISDTVCICCIQVLGLYEGNLTPKHSSLATRREGAGRQILSVCLPRNRGKFQSDTVFANYPAGKIPDATIAKSFLGRIHSPVRGSMFLKIRTFLSDDNGPTAVEYAVMLVLIISVVLGSIIVLGGAAEDSFHNSSQILKTHFDAVVN